MPPEKKKVGDKENYLTDAAIYGKNRTYVRYERKKTKNGKNRSLRWWRRMDSNHRSRRQQIYSLPPLAARELSHVLGINKSLSLFVELVMGLEPATC